MGVHKYRSGYIRVVSFVKENEHIGLVNKYYSNMCLEKPRLYALFRHPNIVKRILYLRRRFEKCNLQVSFLRHYMWVSHRVYSIRLTNIWKKLHSMRKVFPNRINVNLHVLNRLTHIPYICVFLLIKKYTYTPKYVNVIIHMDRIVLDI